MAETQSIAQDKFLLLSVNLLHRALVEPSRTEAKKLYRALSGGDVVGLAAVKMEDGSTAHFSLSFDYTQFQGRLNYGGFRASVLALIRNVSAVLEQDKAPKVFSAQDGSEETIFGVTAPTVEDNKTNVMVLSAQPGGKAGSTVLRLMYLDPSQFAEQTPPSETTASV
jgi:hypothetical protein